MDLMQTMPAFVWLVPVVSLFGLDIAAGVVATVIFALPPGVRLTELGIRQVDAEVVEAGHAFGATPRQILREVQLPLAMPTVMAGVNQVIMLALSMAVIAGLVGAGGLGGAVTTSISRLDVGLGFEAGLSVVVLAIFLDRVTAGAGGASPARAASGPCWSAPPAVVRRPRRRPRPRWSPTRSPCASADPCPVPSARSTEGACPPRPSICKEPLSGTEGGTRPPGAKETTNEAQEDDEPSRGSSVGGHRGADPRRLWVRRQRRRQRRRGDTITLGIIPSWTDGLSMAYLWKNVLEDEGYTVEIEEVTEAAPLYTGVAQGDVDVYPSAWPEVTHASYMEKYGDDLEVLGTYYDDAKLTFAVPEYTDIDSIEDLTGEADRFDGRIVGIEPGAGLTEVTTNSVMPEYGLDGDYELVTSSTTAMLAELETAVNSRRTSWSRCGGRSGPTAPTR